MRLLHNPLIASYPELILGFVRRNNVLIAIISSCIASMAQDNMNSIKPACVAVQLKHIQAGCGTQYTSASILVKKPWTLSTPIQIIRRFKTLATTGVTISRTFFMAAIAAVQDLVKVEQALPEKTEKQLIVKYILIAVSLGIGLSLVISGFISTPVLVSFFSNGQSSGVPSSTNLSKL